MEKALQSRRGGILAVHSRNSGRTTKLVYARWAPRPPSGRRAAWGRSQSVVCCAMTAGAAPRLLLSLRPCVPGLEVAEVLQIVGSASLPEDKEDDDHKAQCGYSYAHPQKSRLCRKCGRAHHNCGVKNAVRTNGTILTLLIRNSPLHASDYHQLCFIHSYPACRGELRI